MLDWGSAAVADYRLDVANAVIMAYALGQPHLAGPMLAGYETATGERVGDLDCFQALALTRRLAIMAAAMQHGAEAVGLKPGADQHLRQHSHLARGVHAWLSGITG
ncbi:MAG: hypothetical protein AB1492_05800 [Bacillota bacterium]